MIRLRLQMLAPLSTRCSWKRRTSSGVAVSGERLSQAANRLQLETWLRCLCGVSLRAAISSSIRWRSGLTVSVLLMESSILSEVDNTSILRTGTRYWGPLARLRASRLLLPRSGLERSDFVHWPISSQIDVRSHVGDWGISGRSAQFLETTRMTRRRRRPCVNDDHRDHRPSLPAGVAPTANLHRASGTAPVYFELASLVTKRRNIMRIAACRIRVCLGSGALLVAMAGITGSAEARLTKIHAGQPVLIDVPAFGATRSYLKIFGTYEGEIDPSDRRNAGIADIALAPLTAGKVRYSSTFAILRPQNPATG